MAARKHPNARLYATWFQVRLKVDSLAPRTLALSIALLCFGQWKVRITTAPTQAADTDRDGRLTGKDAVAFFERSGLPKSELAKVWAFSDSARKGYLDQQSFYKVNIVAPARLAAAVGTTRSCLVVPRLTGCQQPDNLLRHV